MLRTEKNLQEAHAESVNTDAAAVGQGSLDVVDLLLVIARRKWWIVRLTAMMTVLAIVAAFLLKPTYESTAVILPPHQDQSVSALLSGQLGSLASLGGGGLGSGALSLKNPNEIYSQLLLSRTVGTYLVSLFDLKTRFKAKNEEEALKALAKHTRIDLDKSSLIRITVTTKDPVFSSQLANAYVDQLHDLNTNLALTDSSQRRAFYQQQLDQEKIQLANAEADFQLTQKKTGLLQPSGQADMVARSIASIRAQIVARSAQLKALGSFATRENPDYQRLQAEITSLQNQMTNLENSNKSIAPGDIEVTTAKLPESSTEYVRKLRELRLQESIYELLIKQFEAAKIDEAKTAPLIQVVDRAVPAERRSGPPRLLIVLGVSLFTLILTTLWCVLSFVLGIFRSDAEIGPKLSRLKAVSLGRSQE